MYNQWGQSDDIFDQGYKSLRKGVFLVGTCLTVLGVLIILFPKLIAFIIAFLILFAGISALVVSYHIWRLKDRPRPFEWEEHVSEPPRNGEPSGGVHRRRITFIVR